MANVWNRVKTRLKWTSRKELYIYVSLITMVSLTATFVYDIVHLFGTEESDKTTQKFTMALLVSKIIPVTYYFVESSRRKFLEHCRIYLFIALLKYAVTAYIRPLLFAR